MFEFVWGSSVVSEGLNLSQGGQGGPHILFIKDAHLLKSCGRKHIDVYKLLSNNTQKKKSLSLH